MTQPNTRRLRTQFVRIIRCQQTAGGRGGADQRVIAGHRGQQQAQSNPAGTPVQLRMTRDEEDGPRGDEEVNNNDEPGKLPVNCACGNCGKTREAASDGLVLCD